MKKAQDTKPVYVPASRIQVHPVPSLVDIEALGTRTPDDDDDVVPLTRVPSARSSDVSVLTSFRSDKNQNVGKDGQEHVSGVQKHTKHNRTPIRTPVSPGKRKQSLASVASVKSHAARSVKSGRGSVASVASSAKGGGSPIRRRRKRRRGEMGGISGGSLGAAAGESAGDLAAASKTTIATAAGWSENNNVGNDAGSGVVSGVSEGRQSMWSFLNSNSAQSETGAGNIRAGTKKRYNGLKDMMAEIRKRVCLCVYIYL